MNLPKAASNASLYRTFLHISIQAATTLSNNDRRIYALCVGAILLTTVFSSFEGKTTPQMKPATTSDGKNINANHTPHAPGVYLKTRTSTAVKNGAIQEMSAIIAGTLMDGQFTINELQQFTRVVKDHTSKYIYFDSHSKIIVNSENELNAVNYQPVFLRNDKLPDNIKYNDENLIYAGAEKAGKYTKDLLEHGGYTKRVEGVYYVNPDLPPGNGEHQLNHAHNLIQVGDDFRWDQEILKHYQQAEEQTQVSNSWSGWVESNEHSPYVKKALDLPGAKRAIKFANRFSMDHYKKIYTICAILMFATFGSKFIIKKQ